jgi:exportin-7
METLERACEIVVKGSADPATFANANAQVMTLQSSVENIPTLQAVFDASSNSCAILVAARCLQHLITENWNAFTEPQRVDIREWKERRSGRARLPSWRRRTVIWLELLVPSFIVCFVLPIANHAGDYLLNFLGTKGLNLEEFAMKGVVALICRITKFGWFDTPTDVAVPPPTGNAAADAAAAAAAQANAGMRGIVTETTKFLQATVSHCLIGLRILNDLVTEMNYKSKNRSMTQQRKVAVSFRDASLFQIFEISLSMLNQVATRSIALDALPPEQAAKTEDKIIESSLQLLISCLSFDFLGSNPDEDVGDTTSIQVPASWRERLQSGSTLRVLFNLYKGCTTGRISLIPDAPAPAIGGSSGTPSAGSSASSASTFGSSFSSSSSSSSTAADSAKKGGLFGYKPFGGMTATTGPGGQVAAPTRDMRVSFPRAAQCELL